ncbi:MAG: cytochrome b/b6 domain-containing protein [Pseudomonadota bacterium]
MPVWDLSIRLFHWSNAALFLALYGWLEGGGALHEWGGYVALALVLARIGLGLFGRGHARFAAFWPTPTRLAAYLRHFPQGHGEWPGHNPLGGLMILFMLLMLLVTGVSGWLQDTDAFWGEEWVQTLHEGSADAMMVAVVVHVLAVLLMQRLTGVALVRAMVTGRRG